MDEGNPAQHSNIAIFKKKVQDVSGRSVLGVCALIQFQPLQ